MDDLTVGVTRELLSRRITWTGGQPLRLADGNDWRLPVLDLDLLMTSSGLLDAIMGSYHIASETKARGEGSHSQVVSIIRFQGYVANLTVRLLQLNYDLSARQLDELLKFDDLVEFFKMTSVNSSVITEAAPIWVTFGTQAVHKAFSQN